MRNTAAGKARAFSGFKTTVWGLLVLAVSGLLLIAAAETEGTIVRPRVERREQRRADGHDEPGVQGVTLNLRRTDAGEPLTAVSDETGAFLFAALPNGSYAFSVDIPQGMLFARYRKEGGDLRSVLTGDDSAFTRSFIVKNTRTARAVNVGLVDSAIFKGIAYLDLNYNGNYHEGEPPYAGVTLEVIRNASERSMGKTENRRDRGVFFDEIRTGNYRLRAILPDDGSTFSRVPDAPGTLQPVLRPRGAAGKLRRIHRRRKQHGIRVLHRRRAGRQDHRHGVRGRDYSGALEKPTAR